LRCELIATVSTRGNGFPNVTSALTNRETEGVGQRVKVAVVFKCIRILMSSNRPRPGPNQESVWDYPRPPRLESVAERIRVVFNGETIADTTGAYRVLETSHPPVYYIPPEDIREGTLDPARRTSRCEWKGRATYFTVRVNDASAPEAAWAYNNPTDRFEALAEYVAFYPSQMDACYVGDEQARAQEGDFYGGWVTSNIVGPFKGGPGTWGW